MMRCAGVIIESLPWFDWWVLPYFYPRIWGDFKWDVLLIDSSFPVGPQTGKKYLCFVSPWSWPHIAEREADKLSLSWRHCPCVTQVLYDFLFKIVRRATVQWALFLLSKSAMQFLQIQGLCFRAYGTPSLFPLSSTLPPTLPPFHLPLVSPFHPCPLSHLPLVPPFLPLPILFPLPSSFSFLWIAA